MSISRIGNQSIRTTLQKATGCCRLTTARNSAAPWTRTLSDQRRGNGGRHYSNPAFRRFRAPRDSVIFSRARRRFSVSAVAAHGHLTPPKPGEEYGHLL